MLPSSLRCSFPFKLSGTVSWAVLAVSALFLLGEVVNPGEVLAQNDEAVAPAPAASATPPSPTGLVRLSRSNRPIEEVLSEISRLTGKTVTARGRALGQPVTVIFRDVPVEQAVTQIAAQRPGLLVYRPEDQPNTFEIWDQESYRAEVLPRLVRQKVFVPREITAEEASRAIQGVLTANIGSVAFDPRSNKVIVTDLPYVLELCQRLIEQIDVKFITRVFYISHADVTSIADKLRNLKSSAAPDPEVDERTHQIIIRDRLEVIRQMELLVETLDIGPDIRVYDLNNIGFEGTDVEELRTALDRVVTRDAFYQINPRSGKLLLEDVPEVHEKVEKILQTLDAPAKQVLLQAEIVETQFNEGLNYGIDYTLSDELFGAVVDGLTGRTVGAAAGAVTSPGRIPVGSGTVDRKTLGFVDWRREFPITRVSGEGISSQLLMKNAFISLRAAMRDSRTRVLQQPRVIVENQKETRLNIGQNIPYFTGGFINNNNNINSGFNSGPQQQNLTVGLELNIRPTILNSGMVQMEVQLTNSTPIIQTQVFAGQEFTGVGSNEQTIETTLRIPSGETRVIGGLVTDNKSENIGGVPGLVRIPVVGPILFGSYDRNFDDNRRRNLLIFLTPTVVEENPTDLVRFKGRIMEDPEAAADEFMSEGTRPRTNRNLPLTSSPEPFTSSDNVVTRAQVAQATNDALQRMDQNGARRSDPVDSDGPIVPLRRARVEVPEGETPLAMNRMPAPSGALSLTGQGQPGGAVSSPVIPGGPQVAPPGGAPGQPIPIAIQPAPGQPIQIDPATGAVNVSPGTTIQPGVGGTPPAMIPPPQTETRM